MILKKALHIILAFVIIATTTGFTINFYYCHDEVIAIAIDHNTKPFADTPKPCCSDASMYVKVEGNFLTSTFEIQKQIIPLFLSLFSSTDFIVYESEFGGTFNKYKIKTPPFERDLLILNQVFLI